MSTADLPHSRHGRPGRPGLRGALAALLALGLAACGYAFSPQSHPTAAVEAAALCVVPLTNHTAKVGIESIFTNEMVYEVSRNGLVQLAEREAADVVLEGDIRELTTKSTVRSSLSQTVQRRVTVSVDLTLKKRNGHSIWHMSLEDSAEYIVAGDKVSTEGNLRKALAVIGRRMAQAFHNRYTQTF
jgi:hypothetical protein